LGPRAGLDGYGESRPPPPAGIRSPDSPARSKSLHRPSYPCSQKRERERERERERRVDYVQVLVKHDLFSRNLGWEKELKIKNDPRRCVLH